MKHRFSLILWLLCVLILLPVTVSAQTEDTSPISEMEIVSTPPTVQISGLQGGETLHLYKIASVNAWESQVLSWLELDSTVEKFPYFKDSPQILSRLQPDTAETFAQHLVLAMQDADRGGSLTLQDLGARMETGTWQGTLDPGGYLVLPASKQRIYTPKLLVVLDQATTLTYEEDDYSQPSFELTISPQEGEELKDYLIQGEMLTICTELNPGRYPPLFRSEKLVRTLSCTFSADLTPRLENVVVQNDIGHTLTAGQDYTLESFSDVTVYLDENKQALFYESNGLFCFMDGRTIGISTVEAMLTNYQERYHVQTEISDVTCMPGSTVVLITLLAVEEDTLICEYPISMGSTYIPPIESEPIQADSGIALIGGQYHFTTSALESDPLGRIAYLRQFNNYSIEAQLLDGGVAGADGQSQEKPLTGGVFSLYQLIDQLSVADGIDVDGWIQETMAQSSNQGYQVIRTANEVRLYGFHSAQAVDDQGIAGFSGLEPEEHLMVETIYPDGFATLRTAYQITRSAWEQSSFQSVTWRNYTGVYLPETGSTGIQSFTITGTALILTGMLLLIWKKSRKKESDF